MEPVLIDNKNETELRIEKYCESVAQLLNNINEKNCTRKKITAMFDDDIEFMDYDEVLL